MIFVVLILLVGMLVIMCTSNKAITALDKEVRDLKVELMCAKHTRDELRAAIVKHAKATGHDRCWLNDQELYSVMPNLKANFKLPPCDQFLEKCIEYYRSQT